MNRRPVGYGCPGFGQCLVQVSRHIRIDFLLLSEYATVANARVRLLHAFIPAFSFLLMMLLLADETDNGRSRLSDSDSRVWVDHCDLHYPSVRVPGLDSA